MPLILLNYIPMITFLSINTIHAIYQRHISKNQPRAEALGHAAGLLVISGHCANSHQARNFARALFA